VDGQQVGKGAGQLAQAIVGFLQSLRRTKTSVTTAQLLNRTVNEAGVLLALQGQSSRLSLGQSFTERKKTNKQTKDFFPRLCFMM